MTTKKLSLDFSGLRVLVAGEVGIDEYLWGSCRRLSPEAPVPIVEVEKESVRLGMAGNVAQNVVSLGAKAIVLSVRGDDEDGRVAERMLSESGVEPRFLVDASRPTPRKTRIIAQRQHVVRVDRERSDPMNAHLAQQFRLAAEDCLASVDAVIVEDYGKGIWRGDTLGFLARARELGKPVFVDPCRSAPLGSYRGATALTPNLSEAAALTGRAEAPKATDDEAMFRLGRALQEGADLTHAIVTCGEHGMIAVSAGSDSLLRIPTFAREVFDVTGAGDTVVAALTLAHTLGHPLPQAMALANAAAGLVVAHIGTASVTAKELAAEIERLDREGLVPSAFFV